MHRRDLRWGRVAAAVLLTGVAACGSGSSSSSEVTTAAGESATTAGAPPLETASRTTVPPPAGVLIGAEISDETSWTGPRILTFAGEFLQFSVEDGLLAIARSSDGSGPWTPQSTGSALDRVGFAATDGQEILVSSGYGSSTTSVSVSVSPDGGRTWSSEPLPLPPSTDSPYLIVETSLTALAATDGAALAIGTVNHRADWQAYSRDVLGADHGYVTGEGGFSEQWTVEFEDGFDLTLDMRTLGVPELANGTAFTPIGWLRTASGWEIVALPFVNPAGATTELATGPAGFLMLPPPAIPTVEIAGATPTTTVTPYSGPLALPTLLYHSADGRTWQATEPPADVVTYQGFLAGGPLGYVIIGETRMSFSTDGMRWEGVADYDDAAPDASGFLSRYPPSGGAAGFAVTFESGGSGADPRVMISRDGRSWEPVGLPPNSVSALVAVGSETLLVRPVVFTPEPQIPIDTSVIAEGGGAGGLRPAAMCSSSETPMVVAYELDTGAYRWHQCGSGSFFTLAAATENAVYVSEIDGSNSDVLVFEASTGEPLDSVTAAELRAVLPDDAALPSDTPPVTPGVQLSGGQDDPLIATDAETGDQLWSVRDVLAYDDVWAVGDDAVYMLHFGDADGSGVAASVRAYEVATGDVRWETAWPQAAYPWWVADGKVYSIWTDLSVLSTATGEVLWATDYGTDGFPGMRGVLANDDTVFVSFASGFGAGD